MLWPRRADQVVGSACRETAKGGNQQRELPLSVYMRGVRGGEMFLVRGRGLWKATGSPLEAGRGQLRIHVPLPGHIEQYPCCRQWF